jgi:predicted ATPase/DNA-binding SARP family transcriptional activator
VERGLTEPTFRLLGSLEVSVNGTRPALGAPKQRLLLAALASGASEVVSRERAVDAVWGEDPPERTDGALQVYVHHLRRIIGAERIETRGTGYVLQADPNDVDALRFERLVGDGRRALIGDNPRQSAEFLSDALALWRGEAVADLPSVPFVVALRDRLNERRLEATELLYEARLGLGEGGELVSSLDVFVSEHPFRERAVRQLMVALYRAGRQADAIEVFRRMRARFVDELGLDPGPEVRELERAILRQDPSLTPRALPAQAEQARLPQPATPLVGRRVEIAAVTALLTDRDSRLLTLVGPGGVGKTRLAIAAAGELASAMSDGVVFVDLTTTSDPGLLAASIASAARLSSAAHESVDELGKELAQRELLLVLDNFEQILDAAATIAALVADAPRLRILVTSRAPLRVSAERVYPVPPLPTPAPNQAFETIAQSDAVRIFSARAAAADRSFQLTDGNAAAVGDLCRLLEGLPLAIELAAARTKLLSPEQLVERMARPLEVLNAGDRDAPARHQTLGATIDWSYELLAERERSLFAQLSVFAGGCTLDAVEAVCTGDLDSFATLLDNSLLERQQEPGRELRFRMLVTVRSYADSQLIGDERAEARARHALYFVELTEAAKRSKGVDAHEAEILASLDREHDNVRAALAWAQEEGRADILLRLVSAMRLFWTVRGHLEEGTGWFEVALAAPGAAESEYRAQALSGGGTLAYRRGDYELARQWWEEAQIAFEAAGDTAATARTLGDLASIALAAGDLDRAMDLWRQSVAEFRVLGDEMRLAIALANIGVAASAQHDHAQAVESLGEALELSRRARDPSTEGAILFNLGRNHVELGRLDEGQALMEDALRLAHELGYRELAAHCLLGLADTAASSGELGEAARLLEESDELVAALGMQFQQEEIAVRERTVVRLQGAATPT